MREGGKREGEKEREKVREGSYPVDLLQIVSTSSKGGTQTVEEAWE